MLIARPHEITKQVLLTTKYMYNQTQPYKQTTKIMCNYSVRATSVLDSPLMNYSQPSTNYFSNIIQSGMNLYNIEKVLLIWVP